MKNNLILKTVFLISLISNIFNLHILYNPGVNIFERQDQCASSSQFESFTISPDNKYILAIWNQSIVKLWDIQTGTLVRIFTQSSGTTLHQAIFSPDSKRVLISGEDSASLWNIYTGDKLKNFSPELGEFNNTQIYLYFSPDGKYIFTGGSKGLTMWNADTGQKIRFFPGSMENDEYQHAQVSSDGHYVLTNDSTWYIWDAQTGKRLYSFPTAIDESFPATLANKAGTASFSTDGKLVLINNADGFSTWLANPDNTYKRGPILDTRKAKRLWRVSRDNHYAAAFVDDSDLLQNITLWDLSSGYELHVFTFGANSFEPYIFSPDSKYLLVSAEIQPADDTSFQAILWDILKNSTSKNLTINQLGVWGDSLYTIDGKYWVSFDNLRQLQLRDTKTWEKVRNYC